MLRLIGTSARSDRAIGGPRRRISITSRLGRVVVARGRVVAVACPPRSAEPR